MHENADTAAYVPWTFGVYTLYVIHCAHTKTKVSDSKAIFVKWLDRNTKSGT